MTKKKNNKTLLEYISTIIVTSLIVLVMCFAVEFELMFRCEKSINFEELNLDNLSKFATLEELEKQLKENPDDYFLTIRIAQIYESLNNLDRANDLYQNALKLSGRSNFALYSYAMFCAKQDLFVISSTLCEELQGNSKRVNLFKANIYNELAKAFSRNKNYLGAVKSYQVALKYAKNIGDLKFLNEIKTNYALAYVDLADYNVSISEVDEAISNLKNSIKINNNALANYKLGLIYLKIDDELAEKYINKAFRKNIFVINPYIYNSLLTRLIEAKSFEGNDAKANYYSTRLKNFKGELSKSYLYKNQVVAQNSKIIFKKGGFFKKGKYYLVLDLKNITTEPIENLLLKAELFVNGQKYDLQKHFATPSSPFGELSEVQVEFPLSSDIVFNDLKQNNDIFVRYFAKKINKAPWILLKIEFLNI